MSKINNSCACVVYSPIRGHVVDLSEVPDPAFSGKYMGDGVAVVPEGNEVCASSDGEIVSVFETKHAVVFEKKEKFRILLHVGIGSMRLKGEGFTAHVESGQKVKKGDKLLTLDVDYIKKMADDLASPIIMTSPRKGYSIRVVADGHIEIGDPLFEIVDAPE